MWLSGTVMENVLKMGLLDLIFRIINNKLLPSILMMTAPCYQAAFRKLLFPWINYFPLFLHFKQDNHFRELFWREDADF